MRRALALVFILSAFGAGFYKAARHPPPAGFAQPLPVPAQNGAARFQSSFASSDPHTQTHAASLVELKDGRVRAFWFAGSREGAADVQIRSAVFDPAQGLWGKEQTVATREGTQQGLRRYVSKLGNPVAARAADGTLWLYYVTVSVGGWAGSSITAISSRDEGATWGAPQRLVTSPFLNISTLVKGSPFLYGDGTLGLPVYHEFIAKFGELLRLDQNGAVLDKQRLSRGRDHGLQPVLLAKSADEALVLMRHAGDEHRRVLAVSSRDAGQHWTAPATTALSNPDAALTALALGDGRLLTALNNQEAGRDALSLALSADGGQTWKTVQQLEDQRQCGGSNCASEFSYPYLIRAQTGDFHLVYTWNRTFIKHAVFNPAWLEQRLREVK